MLNYISNSVVAFYFPESVLSYYTWVLTLLFLKGTCSETKYCFKFPWCGVPPGKVRLCRDIQTDKCLFMAMIKVQFLRKSFLTPFRRFRTYIFSTFFVFDFPSRVTYLRAEMVYKLLKYKLICSHKKEWLYARDRRTRARSRGHFRLLILTTQEVRNSYNISVHPVYLTFRVIGIRNVQDISMK